MVDAYAEVVLAIFHHVVDDGKDIAWSHVATAQAGRTAVNPRNAVNLLQTVLTGRRVAKGRLDFARQVVARRGKWVVHPLKHSKSRAVFQGLDDLPRGKWPKTTHVQTTNRNALFLAEV